MSTKVDKKFVELLRKAVDERFLYPIHKRTRCPSLKQMAAFITATWPEYTATVEQGECNTDRKSGRLRIPGKGRTGSRIIVTDSNGKRVIDHNNAETYRNSCEVAEIILNKLDGKKNGMDSQGKRIYPREGRRAKMSDPEHCHATSHTDPDAGLPKFSDLRGAWQGMTEHEREAMNDELRKACERCRGFLETGVWNDLPAMPIDAAEDLLIIARHYLATTREDDVEAVTPEWLLSVGFEDDEYCFRIKHKEDGWHDHMRYTQAAVRKLDWKWHANGIGVRGQKTREDVRRLCAALGIELKEAGGGA